MAALRWPRYQRKAVDRTPDTDTMGISRNQDRLALDVYRYAEGTGHRITLGLVERRLDELRAHEPACGCGLRMAAGKVRAGGVWWVVRGWAAGTATSTASPLPTDESISGSPLRCGNPRS